MKKLSYIDVLKGIGALIVYICHFVVAFCYSAYCLSHAAVCLFLVFSGFVLCLSYFSTGDKRRLGKSARRRYLRLMPMILIANIFIFLLMSLGLYRNAETAVLTKSEAWFAGFNQFAPDFLRMLYESLIGCFLQGSNDYNGVLWTIPYLFWGALAVYLTAYLAGGGVRGGAEGAAGGGDAGGGRRGVGFTGRTRWFSWRGWWLIILSSRGWRGP